MKSLKRMDSVIADIYREKKKKIEAFLKMN